MDLDPAEEKSDQVAWTDQSSLGDVMQTSACIAQGLK